MGVGQRKALLSAYLARVKAREVFVVTENGRPIAQVVPAPSGGTEAEAVLERLERSGLLTRGTGGVAETLASMPRSTDASGASLAALLAQRVGQR